MNSRATFESSNVYKAFKQVMMLSMGSIECGLHSASMQMPKSRWNWLLVVLVGLLLRELSTGLVCVVLKPSAFSQSAAACRIGGHDAA